VKEEGDEGMKKVMNTKKRKVRTKEKIKLDLLLDFGTV
jgi:hypothetical protein